MACSKIATCCSNLDAIGVRQEDVDLVVLSRLHFDHAGGLLPPWREGAPARLPFPNARFVVSAGHGRRANDPHPRDRASFIPEWMPLLEKSGGLEWVEGAHYPVRQRRLGRYLAHSIREIPGGIPADA